MSARYNLDTLVFIDRSNGKPMPGQNGAISLQQNSIFSWSREPIPTAGGTGNIAQCVGYGPVTHELTIAFQDIPGNEILSKVLGVAITDSAAEVTGSINNVTNKKGTSVLSSTGIALITKIPSQEANLKFSTYIIEAVTTTTVDVFATSRADFQRGTPGVFIDKFNKIASGLLIASDTEINVGNFGFRLKGATAAIGMTIGDTAVLEINPINTSSSSYKVGGFTDNPVSFGLEMYGQRCVPDTGISNKEKIILFNVAGGANPGAMTTNEFMTNEWTLKPLIDSELNPTVFQVSTVSF